MSASDQARLVRQGVATAVQLLEAQDGLLFPIAHAIDADDRCAFIGAYTGAVVPDPLRALATIRRALGQRSFRSVAVVYGIALSDGSGRNALCIEFESLDAAPETIFVPLIITRPWLRSARIVTYAPTRAPGQNYVLRPAASLESSPQ